MRPSILFTENWDFSTGGPASLNWQKHHQIRLKIIIFTLNYLGPNSRAMRVITEWFVFESNSQFTTTTPTHQFPQITTVLRVIGLNFQTKDFSFFTFSFRTLVCAMGCWKARRLGHKRKSSLNGKRKMMLPTSFFCSNQLNPFSTFSV